MDRKTLLKKILEHLDEALYLMDTTEEQPDDDDAIWHGVMAVHGAAETELNLILIREIQQA